MKGILTSSRISSHQSETRIANRWAEIRNPPRTVQEAFKLADDVESQLQVADSFKLELSNDFSPAKVNEMSAGETSGDESEVNEMSRGKTWGNNSNYKRYNPNNNHNSRPQYSKTHENKTGKTWGTKGKGLQEQVKA